MQENINQNQQAPEQESSALQSIGVFIWDLVKILVIALIIIIPFRTYVAEPFVVSGSSMLPNFHNNDYLIVNRITYITGSPQRGDVVVLRFPKDPSQFFIKRIIGLPGETVSLTQQGQVVVTSNLHPEGVTLTESYLPAHLQTLGNPEAVHLGSNEFYVLGDNRTASSDSRVWGVLPRDLIIGKVWVKVFPFSDAGVFHTPTY